MAIVKKPFSPLSADYRPENGIPYKVRDGDDWRKVASRRGINVKKLIYFNYKTTDPEEVNFYLMRNVGCIEETLDRKNYKFSSDAVPGIIYLPAEDTIISITDTLMTFGFEEAREVSASGINPIVIKSLSGSVKYALWNFWETKLRPVSEPRYSSHYYVYMNTGHQWI
jgi:hypothetical protein